ncbi:MAG: hypothetical protein ACD_15C00176G0003 [uncultured bacterium]|nr:MAG: hypothetical protein ACD_15C00176G0003 [uncultured bacterium]HCU71138.1 hypothetical protein [Candidatus Moranbacteria bacterium]
MDWRLAEMIFKWDVDQENTKGFYYVHPGQPNSIFFEIQVAEKGSHWITFTLEAYMAEFFLVGITEENAFGQEEDYRILPIGFAEAEDAVMTFVETIIIKTLLLSTAEEVLRETLIGEILEKELELS